MPMMVKRSSFWLELAWCEASLSTYAFWAPSGGVPCGVGVPASLSGCEDRLRFSATYVGGRGDGDGPCVAAERAGGGTCDGVSVSVDEAYFALELES